MKDEKLISMALMKIEMKMALDTFKTKYKKATKGIQKIYVDAILSNDYDFVKKKYVKFFGYIQKSKNAKEKWAK